MSGSAVVDSDGTTRVESRVLGRIDGPRPGPTLICIGGIHGNEPAGVLGVRRVLEALDGRGADLSGSFVALAGNMSALGLGRRFVDRDLNRAWTRQRVAALRAHGHEGGTVEDREQFELLTEIETILDGSRGPVYAIDLHTTSGPGGTFSAFTDSLPQRAFASMFPVPMIFGLEELVNGTLLNLLSENGVVALTVETGQHAEAAAVDRAEATVWMALVNARLLTADQAPEAVTARARVERDTGHLPRALEMRYRKDLKPEDRFVMKPGYSNFDPVRASDVVATDRDGPVLAGENGRLLMPLYQVQGEDGFFLVREFSPFWMRVSWVMRQLGLARVAPMLPGVRRVEGTEDEVVVDKRIARFFARQLFHLLGYRQVEDVGNRLLMRRRRFDEGRYLRRPPTPTSLS